MMFRPLSLKDLKKMIFLNPYLGGNILLLAVVAYFIHSACVLSIEQC